MGRAKTHPVALGAADRAMLVRLLRSGSHPAQEVRRARILLLLDEDDPDRDGPVPTQAVVAERAGVSVDLVARVARAYDERGGDAVATIRRKKRLTPPVEPKVTGDVEARVIAMACSTPPPGRARWSLRLLEKHIALVDDIPDLDHTTICRILKRGGFART